MKLGVWMALLVAGLTPATICAPAVAQQPQYRLIDLGTLGGAYSFPTGLNELGQVVGESYPAGTLTSHAFLYSSGVMTDLGASGKSHRRAVGVNEAGQVAGWDFTPGAGSDRAFLYSGGVMTDIGTLGGTASGAAGINNSGQVVGFSTTPQGTAHAFVYADGVMDDLGTLAGGAYSQALGINDAGEIVGQSFTTGDAQHAFLYSGGVMTDLGTLGGQHSLAWRINEVGQIVGQASTSGDAARHAFLYSDGVMSDLGTLGGPDSLAYDVNDSGQIVGQAHTPSDALHAFLYSDGVMTDLNQLLDRSGAGFTVRSATAINNSGMIAAHAQTPSGQQHAVLLTPRFTISNVAAVPGRDSARITWETNRPSTSVIDWGPTRAYGRSARSEVLTESHSTTISVAPNKLYYYRVSSTDAEGDVASGGGTFRTSGNHTRPITISAVQVTVGSRVANISWTTDVAANSKVEYGTTTGYGSIASKRREAINHTIDLDHLAPSTVYHFRVSSRDAFGNVGVSGDDTFATFPGFQGIPQCESDNLRRSGRRLKVDIIMRNAGDRHLVSPLVTGAVLGLDASPNNPRLPHRLGSLAPGASQKFTLTFDASAGARGTATTLGIGGHYGAFPRIGTFSFSWPVTLP